MKHIYSVMATFRCRTDLFLSPLVLLLVFAAFPLSAQTERGSVAGKVITADSLNAEFVTVGLKGTSKGSVTDKDGNFSITDVPEGSYTLVVQIVGYETIEQPVNVRAGETTTLSSIQLKEDSKTLHEVTVEGKRNKFADKNTENISRLPISNLETPQVFNIVSSEMMEEQVATDFRSIAKNVPGASAAGVSHSANGRYMNTMRGFNQGSPARNGLTTTSVAEIDPANIERLEAIKGPSGVMYGASLSTFGGLINRVTKKAYDKFGGNVSFTTGSWSLNRLAIDLNSPIDKDKKVLLRVNAAAHNERSFQDQGFATTYMFAPTLTYKPNNRLTIHLDLELYKRKGTNIYANSIYTNASGAKLVSARSVDELQLDYNKSFTNNSIIGTTNTQNVYGQVNYKISDQWTSQSNFAYGLVDFYFPGLTLTTINDTQLRREVNDQHTRQISSQLQQNFIGDYKIAGLRNRTVIGVDYTNMNFNFPNTRRGSYDTLNYQNLGTPAYSNINIDSYKAFAARRPNAGSTGSYNYIGAYVTNVINFTPKLLLMLGLRGDRYQNNGSYTNSTNVTAGDYTQTALSPKVGIIYQVIKEQVSLFGNYMNGFQYVGGTDINNNAFKPQYANQLEGGVKFEVFKGKLVSTLSYYDITITNTLRTDPTNSSFSIQDGTQNSKGLDVDFIANPVKGLNIFAGYAYNDSKLIRANATVEGKRPTSSGAVHTANIWMSYKFNSGFVKGFGAGFGANYIGEQYIINTTAAEFVVPEYTILDATLFYDTQRLRLAFKVDNLTSQKYWSTSLTPQAPARFSANATFKF